MMAPHSAADRGVTEKMSAAGGTYRMKQCSTMESAMAPNSHRFLHGGSCTHAATHKPSSTHLKPVCTGLHLYHRSWWECLKSFTSYDLPKNLSKAFHPAPPGSSKTKDSS